LRRSAIPQRALAGRIQRGLGDGQFILWQCAARGVSRHLARYAKNKTMCREAAPFIFTVDLGACGRFKREAGAPAQPPT